MGEQMIITIELRKVTSVSGDHYQVVWTDSIPVAPDEGIEIVAPPAPTVKGAIEQALAHVNVLERKLAAGQYRLDIDDEPYPSIDSPLEMQVQGVAGVDPEWHLVGYAYGQMHNKGAVIAEAVGEAKEWIATLRTLTEQLRDK